MKTVRPDRMPRPMENICPYSVIVKGKPTPLVEYLDGTANNCIIQNFGGAAVYICDKEGHKGHFLEAGQSLPLLELGPGCTIYAITPGNSGGQCGVIVW